MAASLFFVLDGCFVSSRLDVRSDICSHDCLSVHANNSAGRHPFLLFGMIILDFKGLIHGITVYLGSAEVGGRFGGAIGG